MHKTQWRSLANELWNYVNKEKLTVSEGLAVLRERHKLTSYAIGHIRHVFETSPLFRSMTRLADRKRVL